MTKAKWKKTARERKELQKYKNKLRSKRERTKLKAKIKVTEYNQRPEIKARRKQYYHRKKHPKEYINVLGTYIYTDGVTKEIKKQLPIIITKKVKEMLSNKEDGINEKRF